VSYRPGEAELGCARRYGRGGTDRRIRGEAGPGNRRHEGDRAGDRDEARSRRREGHDHREVRRARDIPAWCVKRTSARGRGRKKVIQATLDKLGGLDILINSVGGSTAPAGGVLALTDEHWHQALALNLMSAVRLDRGFLPSMLEQGFGVIIHVSSIQRTLPLHESTLAYAAAKAA